MDSFDEGLILQMTKMHAVPGIDLDFSEMTNNFEAEKFIKSENLDNIFLFISNFLKLA